MQAAPVRPAVAEPDFDRTVHDRTVHDRTVHIIIGSDGAARLDQPNDFTAFGIRSIDTAQAAVLSVLAGDGSSAPESDHVYVSVDAVRRLAGGGGTEWEAGFAKMLAYAGPKGWLDTSGTSIKAHIQDS